MRHSGHQQQDSRKHFIPRLSAALWPLTKSPQNGQGQSAWPGPGRQGLAIWVCPRSGLTGDIGMHEEGLLFPENQAFVVGWHIHLGEMLWLKKLPREATQTPRPSYLPSSPREDRWPGPGPPRRPCPAAPTLGSCRGKRGRVGSRPDNLPSQVGPRTPPALTCI